MADVTQHECDNKHETLDSRMDRMDSRMWWMLGMQVLTLISIVGYLGDKLLTK